MRACIETSCEKLGPEVHAEKDAAVRLYFGYTCLLNHVFF
jgi:hypothetical protein